MTPSGLREKVIAERVAWIAQMVADIRALPLEDRSAFATDRRTLAAGESCLRRALEALLDLGRHLLSKGLGLAVAEYRDIPRRLAEAGVLSAEEADLMGQMARYRNRMVHFDHEVSAQELYDLLTGRLVDIERLAATLTRWTAEHPELVDRSL
jgi:uncharacterized protein YutE (UPF0331/DUF86 family)